MATIEQRLLALKQELQQARLDKASAEGALKQNMTRLKDEFKCNTIDQAKTLLNKLSTKEAELRTKIEKAMEKLEADYEW